MLCWRVTHQGYMGAHENTGNSTLKNYAVLKWLNSLGYFIVGHLAGIRLISYAHQSVGATTKWCLAY